MTEAPYPGLRPFRADEIDIFFGREEHVDQLLDRLANHRFLGIVGTSGCGKSSLVTAGLIPALRTGFLARAGARWRVATMRPGDHPIERLTEALLSDEALGLERGQHPLASGLLQASLRRGPLGLAEALSDTPLPERTQLLLVVDQFEEIFRYHRHGNSDEAEAFVALLLRTARQPDLPVYVVLTMRSDFLGDCALFNGLPEALNESQFLTPRLDRRQRHAAITGPAAVFGGSVEPELINRLLNDMGDEPDQLPLAQHLLMRLWTQAAAARADGEPVHLTVKEYDAVGGFEDALSRHADEAFAELDDADQNVAERMFRALCERGADQRDTRRPARLSEIAAATGVESDDVARVAEAFRRPDRSFLMPPAGVELDEDTILDISHESLIRQWDRLRDWVDAEARSAETYRRLVETAALWKTQQAGLWGTPDLDLALAWKERQRPSEVWAERYGGDFALASEFLAASTARRREKQEAHRKAERQREKHRRSKQVSLVLAIGLVATLGFALMTVMERLKSRRHSHYAEAGMLVARAQESIEFFPQRGQLLAVEALRISPKEPRPWWIMGPSHPNLGAVAAIETLQTSLSETGGQALIGHNGKVMELAVTPDGRWLASASEDGTVRLWSLAKPEQKAIVLDAHDGPVTALAVSPDSRWLAAGGATDQIKLWDLEDAKYQPITYHQHRDVVTALAFSSDGRMLLSGSEDRDTHLWQLDGSGGAELVAALGGADDSITAVAFSNDDRWLIAASRDNLARVWNVEDPAADPLVLQGHSGPLLAIALTPDNRWLVTASDDNTARMWRLEQFATGRQPSALVLRGHTSSVNALTTSADGRWLVTGGNDDTSRLWDLETITSKQEAVAVFRGHKSAVSSLAISPDGHWLVTASWDQTARIWNLRGADPPSTSILLRGHDRPIRDLVISPDGRQVATASGDGTARLWPLKEADATTASMVLSGFEDAVSAVAFSPDGRWLATASQDNSTRLWNLDANNLATKPVLLEPHASSINALAISPDGVWLATASDDDTTRLWRLEEPTAAPLVLGGHRSSVNAIAFSPDARWLVTASSDTTARLWDLKNSEADPILLIGHEDSVTSVLVSPDNRWIATASQDHTARVWSLAEEDRGQSRWVLSGHEAPLTTLAVSPDSRRLVSGSRDRTIRVWDLAKGDPGAKPQVVDAHLGTVVAVAVSPDGRWLASSSETGSARLWNFPAFGAPIVQHDHQAAVTDLTFSPDGHWLATACADNSAKIWDMTQETVKVRHLHGHGSAVVTLAASDDGTMLATGSRDKTARLWRLSLWNLSKDELIELACQSVGRNLSAHEWKQFLPPGSPYEPMGCPGLPSIEGEV